MGLKAPKRGEAELGELWLKVAHVVLTKTHVVEKVAAALAVSGIDVLYLGGKCRFHSDAIVPQCFKLGAHCLQCAPSLKH